MPDPAEESIWIGRAQCGDREALELLLRTTEPWLRRYVVRLVGRYHADDVLQDVLIIIARKLSWLSDPRLFRPWAFRIASREAFRRLRRETRQRLHDAEESVIEALAAPAPKPSPEDLAEFLTTASLSPASRAVLILHFYEEMPLAEIAAVLEIPLGTVKSRLAYGLKTLRSQLGESRKLS